MAYNYNSEQQAAINKFLADTQEFITSFSNGEEANATTFNKRRNETEGILAKLKEFVDTQGNTLDSQQEMISGKQKSISVQNTAPTSPSLNDFWIDTSNIPALYKYWNGTEWTLIGGAANGISDLTDVVIISPTSGQVLRYNGSKWVNSEAPSGSGGGSGGNGYGYGGFGGAVAVPTRQTVLSGETNEQGYPNLLEGNGLNVNLRASSKPCVIAFADGYDDAGAIDYVESINNTIPAAWTVPVSTTSYLYIDRAPLGALSYGSTTIPPHYGVFKPEPIPGLPYKAEWAFEDNDETSIVKDTGEVYNGVLSGNNTTSSRSVNTTGSKGFLMQPGDSVDISTLTGPLESLSIRFHTSESFTAGSSAIRLFQLNENNYFMLGEFSSLADGETISICNVGTPNRRTFTFDTVPSGYNTITFNYEGSSYAIYLNGVKLTTTAGTSDGHVPKFTLGSTVKIPGNRSNPDKSLTLDTVALFTRPLTPQEISQLHNGGAGYEWYFNRYGVNTHWFDLNEMKMKVWDGSSWISKQRVFIGQATANTSTTTSTITYAFQGKYDSGAFPVAALTNYTKNHNLGVVPSVAYSFLRYSSDYDWIENQYSINGADQYGSRTTVNKLTAMIGFANRISYGGASASGAWGINTSFPAQSSTGEARIIVERGW